VAAVAAPSKTTLTELPESRVRMAIEVSPGELEDRVQHRAGRLGKDLKLPGFRRGKVPPALVLQRLGWETVLEEVVREDLGVWYVAAIEQTGIVPVGDPKIDLGELPGRGEALELTIEVGVLPKAQLGQYKGLEVGRAEPAIQEQSIDAEVQRLRERLGRLQTAERAAESGDFVVIDYQGAIAEQGEPESGGATAATPPTGAESEALSGRDRLVELGAGKLLPGFEQALVGARAGDRHCVEVSFPREHPDERLAGRDASFQLTLKEVKHMELPEIDEDLAIDVGFDTVQELREDIATRLADAERQRIDSEFREAALDAAVANAQISTPSALVQARAGEMWERMLHSLSHRGISRDAYLQIDGRPESEILAELESDAERALRREALLTAVVAAEGIEPDEDALLQALAPAAAEQSVEPEKLLQQLRKAGRLEELREDLATRQAIELIAAQATPIPLERAHAREKLWTPESQMRSEQEQAPDGVGERAGELWTPDR
jgi:trigger factor